MDDTTLLETGIPLDDLRVKELEPRLEFIAPAGCLDTPAGGGCDYCLYEEIPGFLYKKVAC